ncbi:MAG: DUF373 family protein [Thaumarchaeota archaeon]|nr:DUF373 family protein [Nitrososphaerota archaeon]RNJ71558.1 MAG: DUF373 family protein [Thaumarchaeota archaeon S13]RNJ71860.1 MAG: DUF373 family protein [Thaumarchaeota archaeon S14]MDD9809397.1 DUF373 family protein [Nitrososphaerota archaeon]MDD9812733.1 DUF373 family protein [Nitrososphaerota archaeon]
MAQEIGKVRKMAASASGRTLVICVDRDNDIGDKAGIETPVVGRDACLEAAQRLALEDPEDADSNAIFSAVKSYEDLLSRGNAAEVAIVAGVGRRGVQADEKIVAEVRSVTEAFGATGAVIVSDGEDDEAVIPVIQNVVPVISVQRVVMKVSHTIEHSYAVFGKYIKMVMYDAHYSKFFLGVPGILLLIGGIATVLGYATQIASILVIIFAGALITRAFDIDKAWINWTKPEPEALVRLFTMVTGIVLIIASVPAGVSTVAGVSGADIAGLSLDRETAGQFMAGALPILWIGIGVMLGGMTLSHLFAGARREVGDVLRLIALGALYPTLNQFTAILANGASEFTLVPPLLAGLGVTLAAALILFRRYKGQRDAAPDAKGA